MVTASAPGSAPSPQSEVVTNELQELSLQSGPCLLPLKERKNVLQLKLQQRRTREELANQGIMPPLKSPAAFHEQRRSLERARTEDYLKRKIKTRPERSELVRMHILEETLAEPSLQAKQLRLKRARLADNLNDKISHRPGPMELMQKNILPVLRCRLKHSTAEGAAESSSLDEDSSDALSPDQPTNHSSPLEHASLPSPPDTLTHCSNPSPTQFLSQIPLLSLSEPSLPHRLTNGTSPLRGSRPSAGVTKARSDRPSQRSKKLRDSKPKVKKLKYHQYIPPDQKAEREPPPPMDDSYAKILHQQQLFLQLQIINQQQQHYNYHTILPAPPKPSETPNTSPSRSRNAPASSTASSNQSAPSRQSQASVGGAKPGSLPPNLDELKVAELKQELKLRSLPVSGTKSDLIERLRLYQQLNGVRAGVGGASRTGAPKNSPTRLQHAQPAALSPSHGDTPIFHHSGERGLILASLPALATPGTPNPMMHPGSTSSSPPLSPTCSERSSAGMSMDETSCNGDVFGEMVSSPLTQLSLHPSPQRESGSPASSSAAWLLSQHSPLSQDKDLMLREKDRRIEELTRMLQHKQRLVETLRSQLEQGKMAAAPAPVKTEPPEPPESPGDTAVEEEEEEEEEELGPRAGRSRPQVRHGPVDQSRPQVPLQQRPADQSQQELQLQQRPVDQSQLQQLLVQQGQKRQAQPQSEQMSPVFLGSQSGTPDPAPSFSLDLFKAHPTPTLLTDSNGNHYLIAVTSQGVAGQRNGSPQGKVPGRITLQRLPSSPSKNPVQSATQPASTDSQSKQALQPGLVTQPTRKGQKPGLHIVNSSSQEAGLSLSPANPPAFFLSDESAPSGGHTPSSPTPKLIGEGSSSLDQHTLFQPPSPARKQTYSSTQRKNGCSQHMDDLFDILMQSGELLSGPKAAPDPSLSRLHPSSPSIPSPTPSPPSPAGPLTSRGAPEKTAVAPRAPGGGGRTCAGSGRLEDFLESTTGSPLIGVEPDAPLTLIDDLHSQMLSTSSILDHAPTPMDTCELGFTPQPPWPDFGDSALDSMDWLDVGTSGAGGVGLAPLSSHMPPSVFSVDFLDSPDLQLHWDS
ncbi:myocardin-related transcription factor A-like isoform X2 [Conger conger]|uniref:myocardin-related transcription factor A-like isoform X2 n=1 Tax=Conger conger TaxID=82655 RepID=UPI002A59F08B|nr:myocardin-related transcription factor A-like isoform X2 [Conger conger]